VFLAELAESAAQKQDLDAFIIQCKHNQLGSHRPAFPRLWRRRKRYISLWIQRNGPVFRSGDYDFPHHFAQLSVFPLNITGSLLSRFPPFVFVAWLCLKSRQAQSPAVSVEANCFFIFAMRFRAKRKSPPNFSSLIGIQLLRGDA
jgi:hypothetical protein